MYTNLTYTKLTYWLGITRKDGLCWRRAATENGITYKKGDKFDGGYLLGRRQCRQRLEFFCKFERWPKDGELPLEILSTEGRRKAAKQPPTHANLLAYLMYRRGNLYWKDNGKIFGRVHKQGYRQGTFFGHATGVHRFIFFYHHGRWPKMIDHINSVRSDNRIENLRECTPTQNGINRAHRNATTGYRGVAVSGTGYRARIRIAGKRTHLGCFPTADLAAAAYNEAAVEHHGEFAILNEIGGN